MTRLQKIWFVMNQKKRKSAGSAKSEKQDEMVLLCDSEGRILYDSDGRILYAKM